MKREEQGTSLYAFEKKDSQNRKHLRLGKAVPKKDINLSYLHTPSVDAQENMSLVDTSAQGQNIIPEDQRSSIVAADENGKLSYVDVIENNQIQPRPPYHIFPSSDIKLTRHFQHHRFETEYALYYKFEITYHYDSRPAKEIENWVPYQGNQIYITDESSVPLDSNQYKHKIYVYAHEKNPHIQTVAVYMQMNTNKTETYKIQYNHIDEIVEDEKIYSTPHHLEFYTNHENEIIIDGQTKQMMEGGKIRIINGASAYQEKPLTEVINQQEIDPTKEIYAIDAISNHEGYEITVPQQAKEDPRSPLIFNYRIVGEYTENGETVRLTTGYITDWVLNQEALMEHEKKEYTDRWKKLGLKKEWSKQDLYHSLVYSLPVGTPSLPDPEEMTFRIEDDQGQVLYTYTDHTDNFAIDTRIQPSTQRYAEAKANALNEEPWKEISSDNVLLRSHAIPHQCSIIPEYQETEWVFEWKVEGEGEIHTPTDYETHWQVCAHVGYEQNTPSNLTDVTTSRYWQVIGKDITTDKWIDYYYNALNRNVLELTVNKVDFAAYWQQEAEVNGVQEDLTLKEDYEFSAVVRVEDPHDDDIIGIMFRVQDSEHFYCFAWEGERLMNEDETYQSYEIPERHQIDFADGTVNGVGRIVLDERGCSVYRYIEGVNPIPDSYTIDNFTDYQAVGFGKNHKRIFKVKPQNESVVPHEGYNQDTADKTGLSFFDITSKQGTYQTEIGRKGWEYNKDYKITVVVTGNHFRIFINEDPYSNDRGALVCEATDDEPISSQYRKGSYGIFCISQQWAIWSDLTLTEIDQQVICTEKEPIALTQANTKIKASSKKAEDLLQPWIDQYAQNQGYEPGAYEIFGYEGSSDRNDTLVSIDGATGFIYVETTNEKAGGIEITPWYIDPIIGSTYIEYHADGHYTVKHSPSTLPTENIPSYIKNFHWKNPVIISSSGSVSIDLNIDEDNKITATPPTTLPPIQKIGQPYVLDLHEIQKKDGVVELGKLFGESGIWDQLQIPNEIEMKNILLRIERGKVTSNGEPQPSTMEHRVNYRFRCKKEDALRMPIDQFQDYLGVNRLRMKTLLNQENELYKDVEVSIVAWTEFEELEAVPVFGIKYEKTKRIYAEKPKVPASVMPLDNWYVRIKNGKFYKRLTLPSYEEQAPVIPEIYKQYGEPLIQYYQNHPYAYDPNKVVEVDAEYRIHEYKSQEFFNQPYMLIEKESPRVLNDFQVQVSHTPIVIEKQKGGYPIQVTAVYANQQRQLRIADIDANKGIIYLIDRIHDQDQIYVQYLYKEEWYTYKGFDYYNENHEHIGYFHIDFNPTPGHYYSIHHEGVHEIIPLDYQLQDIQIKEKKSLELIAKPIHLYLEPVSIRDINTGEPIAGTIKSTAIRHTDQEDYFHYMSKRYNPALFRLAKIQMQAHAKAETDWTILDTRTRGGGLDPVVTKEIIEKIYQEASHHWDIGFFDGKAYQENGVFVIQLPKTLLTEFKHEDIQKAIAKHKALGTLPIIEYYDTKENQDTGFDESGAEIYEI